MADGSSSKEQVARAAGIVMFAIFLSRVLGFVRERAIATVFGRTGATDVFFAAFALPDLMYSLLVGGVISSAFIPVFTQYLTAEDEKQAWYVASSFLNVISALLIVMTVLGIVFTPVLAPLVGVGFSGEQRILLIKLMRITFPAVFFTALSGVSMGVLNSYKKFTLPAMGPLLYNSAQILSAYLLGPIFGIVGMAYGTVVGSASSFLIQMPTVFKLGRKHYRRVIDFKHPGIKQMYKLMLPAIIGLSIAQINMIVGQNLASMLATGSIVALRIANRLINFPLGIFAMGLSTAIFPTLATQAAKKDIGALKETFSFGLRLVLYITIPAAVGMAVLRVPIVRLLFETGEFTSQDTNATAYALLFYSIGLVAQAGLQILTRVFYSLQDTVTPVKAGFISVMLNLFFSLIVVKWTNLDIGGLALAFSVASLFQMLILIWHLRRKLGMIDGRRIIDTFLRSSFAALIMGLGSFATANYLAIYVNLGTTSGRLIQTMGAILIGIGIYLILSFMMKMSEPQFVLDLVKAKMRKVKK